MYTYVYSRPYPYSVPRHYTWSCFEIYTWSSVCTDSEESIGLVCGAALTRAE